MSALLFSNFDRDYRKKKKGQKLRDIDITEISLVDAAANRRSFFLKKRAKAAPESADAGDSGDTADETGLDEKISAFMGGVDASTLPDLAAALDTLIKWGADLPGPIKAAVQALLQGMEIGEADEESEPDAAMSADEVLPSGRQKKVAKSTETFPSLKGFAIRLLAGVNPNLAAEMIANGRAEERRIAKSMGADGDDDFEGEIDRLTRENDRLRRTRGISKSIRGQEHISESELGEEEVPFPSLAGMFSR